MNTVTHLINGQEVDCEARYADVFNPATGEFARKVALGSTEAVNSAVAAAKAAFPAWRATPPLNALSIYFDLSNC